jgi:hypothetical protein
MSSHAVSQEQPGPAMSHRPRHDHLACQWRPRWRPNTAAILMVAATTLMLTVFLLGPGRGADGSGWGSAEAQAGTPLETLGVPSAGHVPLALTGPRGITIAASLNEGRQRFGQMVEPGTPGLAGGGLRPGTGPTAIVLQPAYLTAHGPFDVRAPPASV